MSMFEELLISPQKLSYKQGIFDYAYYNMSGNYYIKKDIESHSKIMWEVYLCHNNVRMSYNITSITLLSKEYNIQFKAVQNIFLKSYEISAPSLKQAHQLIQDLFTTYAPNLVLQHNLKRKGSPLFQIQNQQKNLYLPCLNIVQTEKGYHFNDKKFKTGIQQYTALPSYFSSKPQAVKFLHQFIADNLYNLYLENKEEYMLSKDEAYVIDEVWWKLFLREEVALDKVFK